ncbi:MAG: hypothetical protein ACTSP3_13220 [Candidatus Heimdallarchaeaceae archaeon]
MSTFIELWGERNKTIMRDIEELLSKEKKEDVRLFITKEGLDYERNFNILFVEIFQSSLSGLMNKVNSMQEKLMSLDFTEEEEKRILSFEEITEVQKNRIGEIFSEIKFRLKQLKKIGEEISKYYVELHSITDYENNEEKVHDEKDSENVIEIGKSENGTQIDVLSRLVGCFVFSLYAYMDVYCVSLFQSIICCSSPESLFDVYDQLNKATNPRRSVEALLKTICILYDEDENVILNLVNQRVNSIIEWKERYDSFKTFIKIRNKIAHRQPFLDIEELKMKFPKLSKKIEIEIKEQTLEYEKFLNSQPIRISIAEDMMRSFWDNVINLIYLKKIGFESSIYLALIDRLVYDFLNDINCFEENNDLE